MERLDPKRKRPKKKRTTVVSRHGRHRFQTGMITATLLQRGLAMREAFEISRALRECVGAREEITTEQLVEELEALLAERGIDAPDGAPDGAPLSPDGGPLSRDDGGLIVLTATGERPFSREDLLRDLFSGLQQNGVLEVWHYDKFGI